MTKGHLNQEFKNLRPTINTETATPSPDPNPEPEALLSATHDLFTTLVTKEEDVIYTDIAGQYPIK